MGGHRKRGGYIGNVPDGWLNCPATSTGFVDDRFFVFKTPLKQELNKKVQNSERFSIDNVFEEVQRMNHSRLGLWIDLTNTSRYYSASEIENRGVEYKKLACEGHGKPPSRGVVNAFCHLVHGFFRRNNRDYIGVHCTHGFNRTGFFICSYLIRFQKFTPEEAVMEFARVRAPGIYRQMYVDELYSMCPKPQRPIRVTQPSWLKAEKPSSSRQNEIANSLEEGTSSSSSSCDKTGDLPSSSSSSSSKTLMQKNRCRADELLPLATPLLKDVEVAS